MKKFCLTLNLLDLNMNFSHFSCIFIQCFDLDLGCNNLETSVGSLQNPQICTLDMTILSF